MSLASTSTWRLYLLNFVLGGVAAVGLASIVRHFADERAAVRAVAFWAFFPTAFVLSLPYAEAMYATFASGFLLALLKRRHGLAALLLLGAALSRGYALPLSAAALCAVALALVAMQRQAHQAADAGAPFRSRWPSSGLVMLTAAAALAPVLWIGIAAIVTGRRDAYTATQAAWGFAFDPEASVERWRHALPSFGEDWYFTAVVLTLAAVLLLTVMAFRRSMPAELRTYAATSALFLCAISQPQSIAFSSIPRFAFGILTVPIVLAFVVRNTLASTAVVAGFVLLQFLWVFNVWTGRIGVAP